MAVISAIDEGSDADRVLKTGHELATAFDEPLVVLHVLSEERFDSRQERHDEYYRDDAATDARKIAREIADRVLGDEDFEVVGRVGKPVTEILAEVERRDTRYLVIGGRKRTPVGKALFGSVTQAILLNAEAPVVTVMHDD